MFKKLVCLSVLLLVSFATLSFAQDAQYSIWDWQHRTQLSVSSAFLQTSVYSGELSIPEIPLWRGVDIAPTVTYSWHRLLSTYVSYAHGFPFDGDNCQINMLRAAFNFNVYPGLREEKTDAALAIGYGALWYGNTTIKDWVGTEAHVTGAYKVHPRIALFTTYSHAFGPPSNPVDHDFLRAGLTCKIW